MVSIFWYVIALANYKAISQVAIFEVKIAIFNNFEAMLILLDN